MPLEEITADGLKQAGCLRSLSEKFEPPASYAATFFSENSLQNTYLCVHWIYKPHRHMANTATKHPLLVAFERMRYRLQKLSASITGNDEDAEDALQDAFERLWTKVPQPADTEQAAALMATTVRNLSIDRVRRRLTRPTEELDDARLSVPDDTDEAAREAERKFQTVQRIMEQRLSAQQRTVLQMRDYEGRSYADIASTLQVQEATVRMQLSRARKTVRETYLQMRYETTE